MARRQLRIDGDGVSRLEHVGHIAGGDHDRTSAKAQLPLYGGEVVQLRLSGPISPLRHCLLLFSDEGRKGPLREARVFEELSNYLGYSPHVRILTDLLRAVYLRTLSQRKVVVPTL